MQTSIQTIEEIKVDAAALQKKVLSLPVPGEEVNVKQHKLIEALQTGLSGWIGWDLGELEKSFNEET